MHPAFADVLWAALGLGVLASIWAVAGSSAQWQRYEQRGMIMERPRDVGTNPVIEAVERDSEIRQMIEAANTRRARRGEPQLDVDVEIARLIRADPISEPGSERPLGIELEDEIRALVALRNQRHIRNGQAPLDVEAEVRRKRAELQLLNR